MRAAEDRGVAITAKKRKRMKTTRARTVFPDMAIHLYEAFMAPVGQIPSTADEPLRTTRNPLLLKQLRRNPRLLETLADTRPKKSFNFFDAQ
jgi:hypothetical protein